MVLLKCIETCCKWSFGIHCIRPLYDVMTHTFPDLLDGTAVIVAHKHCNWCTVFRIIHCWLCRHIGFHSLERSCPIESTVMLPGWTTIPTCHLACSTTFCPHVIQLFQERLSGKSEKVHATIPWGNPWTTGHNSRRDCLQCLWTDSVRKCCVQHLTILKKE